MSDVKYTQNIYKPVHIPDTTPHDRYARVLEYAQRHRLPMYVGNDASGRAAFVGWRPEMSYNEVARAKAQIEALVRGDTI